MDYYNNNYNPETDNQYSDFGGGSFESGSPVVQSMQDFKSLMYQEVITKSFLFMFAALLVTAYAAYSSSGYMLTWLLQNGSNFYILCGAELAIVLVSNVTIHKNKPVLTAVLFTAYSYLTGSLLGIIFLAYTTASVVSIFLITSAIFAVMAVYGLLTKKDLSSIGNLCLMGLLGIVAAGIVNLFLGNDMVDTVICAVGVLVFVGLTAYDTQKIKRNVEYSNSDNVLTLALSGAFELYLDFINLFLKLLRLLGKKR